MTKENEKEIFENRCYELYQLEWMMSHGFSLKDLINGIITEAVEGYDYRDYFDDEGRFSFNGNDLDSLLDGAQHDFIMDTGFGNGSIFVCKDEFLDTEYQDPDYMKWLFETQVDTEADRLKAQYKKYTGTDLDSRHQLKVHTTAGTLKAYKSTMPDNPGIIIMLQPDGYEYEIDVTQALVYETPEIQATANEHKDIGAQDVEIINWGDATTEDYTHSEVIRRNDIETGLSTETPESQLN